MRTSLQAPIRPDSPPYGRQPGPNLRRAALVVVAMAVLATIAALAGCSPSGSKSASSSVTFADAAPAANAPQAAASSAASGSNESGSNGSGSNGAGSNGAGSNDSAAGSGRSAGAIAGPAKVADGSDLRLGSTALIKTADVTIAAKDVNAAADSAVAFANSTGGAASSDTRTAATPSQPASGSAELTLKVPPDQLEATLTRLDSLGPERSRTSSSQDVTGQVADVNSRVASAQASIAQLQALFSRATAVGDVVSIEGQLAQRESDLESLQAQQRALSAQTSYATITLHLVPLAAPVTKPKPADHSGFGGGFANGWHAFTKALGWSLTAVGAALPFALLLGLIGWAVIAIRRHYPTSGVKRSDTEGLTPEV